MATTIAFFAGAVCGCTFGVLVTAVLVAGGDGE